jgi:hypothetical protein
MLDMDSLRKRIAKPDAEYVPPPEGASDESGSDHYGDLFDALKSGDREKGVAALKACLMPV